MRINIETNDNPNWEKPEIHHSVLTKYNYIVQYPENLKLGVNFDIGTFSYINAKFGVEINDEFCNFTNNHKN